MTSKYTPGPWTPYGTKVGAKRPPVGHIVGDTTIADCYGSRGIPTAERYANARLIAAAPEMAEVLKAIILHPNFWGCIDPVGSGGVDLRKQAQEILQKAGLL